MTWLFVVIALVAMINVIVSWHNLQLAIKHEQRMFILMQESQALIHKLDKAAQVM